MHDFWLHSGNSEMDPVARHIINPERIVWSNNASGSIKNMDTLLKKDKKPCVITCNKIDPPSMVIDFGQELNGGVVMEFSNGDPSMMVKTRIRFGESVSETMGAPNNDHCIHDIVLDMSVMGKHEFGNTGFRFVRLDFIDCGIEVHLASVQAIALERQLEYKGRFECSDPLLNKIWRTGARTVHLCCQEHIFDGIKRDRIMWMGDMHSQMHVIASVFGDIDIVSKSLNFILDNTEENGWMNHHSSYSVWWLITVWDWYLFTGDKQWLKSQEKGIVRIAKQIMDHVDEYGQERLGGMRFIDWSVGFDLTVVDQGLQALTILGIKSAKKLFEELNDQEHRDQSNEVLSRLSRAKMVEVDSKQVGALRVLAEMIDAVEANKMCLSVNPFKGLSTWYGYYALEARAMAHDFHGCLDYIRKFWGGMLDLGATSFWEHFDIDWLENASRIDQIVPAGKVDTHAGRGEHCYKGLRHSLCHGWAAGPTAWMSKHILGIKIIKPGFKQIKIAPNLVDLEYASGRFPTPFGNITIEHTKSKNGKIETKYEVPSRVEIV